MLHNRRVGAAMALGLAAIPFGGMAIGPGGQQSRGISKPASGNEVATMDTEARNAESAGPHARPSLVCESTALVAGQSAMLGVTFKIDEHWHLYWRGQNTAGMAPNIKLGLPKGLAAGEILWPAPERRTQPGADDIVSYVYENQVTLLVPIQVGKELAGSTVTVSASLDWLVCAEGCVLEAAGAAISLPVMPSGTKPAASAEAPLFEATRKRLPAAWSEQSQEVRVSIENKHARIEAKGAKSVAFHPDEAGVTIVNAATDGFRQASALDLELEESSESRPLLGIVEVVREGEAIPRWFAVRVPTVDGEPKPEPK